MEPDCLLMQLLRTRCKGWKVGPAHVGPFKAPDRGVQTSQRTQEKNQRPPQGDEKSHMLTRELAYR